MQGIMFGFLFALIVIGICMISTLLGIAVERHVEKRRKGRGK